MLSQRGQGELQDEGPSVVSKLSGRFVLRNGALDFSDLTLAVPGAIVQLAGTFDLKRDALDFGGHLLLDASLAETTAGIKSGPAKVAQPFFRRPGGGSKLPIRISGPRAKPAFGLDVKRALTPGNRALAAQSAPHCSPVGRNLLSSGGSGAQVSCQCSRRLVLMPRCRTATPPHRGTSVARRRLLARRVQKPQTRMRGESIGPLRFERTRSLRGGAERYRCSRN